MKTLLVEGKKRETLGKKESKRLRAEEIVPAVLYGGEEPVHFSIPFSELRKLVYTPSVYLIDLDIEGEKYKAIIQDMQWHPVEEQILHIDFLKVQEDQPMKIAVPVKLTGLARGMKAGGKLKNNLRRLKVKALAENLPDEIVIDITKLGIGQNIKVGDLKRDNLEFLDSKSNVVAAIITSRAARSAMGKAAAADDDEEEGETDEAAASEE